MKALSPLPTAALLMACLWAVAVYSQAVSHSIADQLENGQEGREGSLLERSRLYHQEQDELILKFTSTQDRDVSIAAAYLMGLYRMDRAAPVLAKEIALQEKVIRRQKEWLWDAYPVAEALSKIGTPSVRPVVDNITTSDDATVRELSLRVLRVIETPKVAKFILEDRLANETDHERQDRLRAAISDLESFAKANPDSN